MVMFMVNIAEAKAKLSEYLDAVGRGERVVIWKHNRPVAELRAVASGTTAKRRLGAAAGISSTFRRRSLLRFPTRTWTRSRGN